MNRVYLVGVISEDPKTHQWRREAVKKLADKFEIDDPTASKFDRELLKEAEGDAEKIHQLTDKYQAEILLPKSYQSVKRADIIIANFAIEASDRPMVGSIMEIAWAYILNKVVIAIKGENYYFKHPMIKATVHAWAADINEACEIVKEFFTTKR